LLFVFYLFACFVIINIRKNASSEVPRYECFLSTCTSPFLSANIRVSIFSP